MSEAATCYVFAGVGSEYSLAPLAAFMRERGRRCVELDMARDGWRNGVAESLSADRRVFISSQHPYMNAHHYRVYYGVDMDVVNVPELQAILTPARSYYVPHDLLSPIKETEVPGLTLFDAVLMPSDSWWYLSTYVRCETVGWIKAAPADDVRCLENGGLRIAWMPSEIGAWLTRPDAMFEQVYEGLLNLRPMFKLPSFPGTEAMFAVARSAGCEVYDASVQSSALIRQAHVVVSNGLSSICAEAALYGVPTLCIDDGSVESWYLREYWQAIPPVAVHTPDEAWAMLSLWKDDLSRLPRISGSHIMTFDFEKAMSILESI